MPTLLTAITGAALFAGLTWGSARGNVAVLLVLWTLSLAVFAYSNLEARFVWIPQFIAIAGIFGSIVPLAFHSNITLVANVATLLLFIVSLELLRKQRPLHAAAQHRA